MKLLVTITFCVVFLMPYYVFAQNQVSSDKAEKVTLKTQVIKKQGTYTNTLSTDTAPDNVITTKSKPVPRPVMKSASLRKSTLEEQILKYERRLASLSDEYRQANPDIVKNLELIIQRKKAEKSLREKAVESTPSN